MVSESVQSAQERGRRGTEQELAMCQSCIDINKRIEELRDTLLRPETDAAEVDRVHGLIYDLYWERLRLHQIPED
jgi:hypothetical protein